MIQVLLVIPGETGAGRKNTFLKQFCVFAELRVDISEIFLQVNTLLALDSSILWYSCNKKKIPAM